MLQEAAGLTTELRTTATDFDLGWSSALALQIKAEYCSFSRCRILEIV
jgi:hypothetical protein